MKRDRITCLYFRAVGRGLIVPGRDDPADPEVAWRFDRIAFELDREAAAAEEEALLRYAAAAASCVWITHHSAGRDLETARASALRLSDLHRPWVPRADPAKPSAERVAEWARGFGYEPDSPELAVAVEDMCQALDALAAEETPQEKVARAAG